MTRSMVPKSRALRVRRARQSEQSRQESPAGSAHGRELSAMEHGLLEKIADVMMLSGVGASQLKAAFGRIAAKTSHRRARRSGPTAGREWWFYAHVLTVWHQFPEFTDENGLGRPLPLVGRTRSFAALVARALPRSKPGHILTALESLGAVKRLENGSVLPLSRSLIVRKRTQMPMHGGLQMLDALVSTIHFNGVQNRARKPGRGLFERAVLCERFDLRHLRALDALVRTHGQALLEFLDNWFSHHEASPKTSKRNVGHAGVGIYVFAKKGSLLPIRVGSSVPR